MIWLAGKISSNQNRQPVIVMMAVASEIRKSGGTKRYCAIESNLSW